MVEFEGQRDAAWAALAACNRAASEVSVVLGPGITSPA